MSRPRPINDTARVNWIADWLTQVITVEDAQVKTVEVEWVACRDEEPDTHRIQRSGRSLRTAFRRAVDAAMHEQTQRRKKR